MYPIPEGTTCDYCNEAATHTNMYGIYCCNHHSVTWNGIAKLSNGANRGWIKLAMLAAVAEESLERSSL